MTIMIMMMMDHLFIVKKWKNLTVCITY